MTLAPEGVGLVRADCDTVPIHFRTRSRVQVPYHGAGRGSRCRKLERKLNRLTLYRGGAFCFLVFSTAASFWRSLRAGHGGVHGCVEVQKTPTPRKPSRFCGSLTHGANGETICPRKRQGRGWNMLRGPDDRAGPHTETSGSMPLVLASSLLR